MKLALVQSPYLLAGRGPAGSATVAANPSASYENSDMKKTFWEVDQQFAGASLTSIFAPQS
jgi:hypothetical protein